MKIAVIGSINMDMVVSASRIPLKGETITGENISYIPGGKGANQAVAIARLGADVTMFACVGDDDNGRELLHKLNAEKVNITDIKVAKNTPTGVALITVGDNDNTIVIVPGANGHVDNAYIDSIKDKLKAYDIVLLQHEISSEVTEYIVDFLYENNIKIILNPAPVRSVSKNVLDKVTYLTPNEHEYKILFAGEQVDYKEKLIITQGEKGVSVTLKTGEKLTVPCIKVKVADTTGAGDTLNGSFAFAISRGMDIKKALRFANTAAGLSVEKFGAQGGMPGFDEVMKRMED